MLGGGQGPHELTEDGGGSGSYSMFGLGAVSLRNYYLRTEKKTMTGSFWGRIDPKGRNNLATS